MTRSALADRVLAGDPRAVARAITLIEDEAPAAAGAGRARSSRRTGRAYLVGVTGPPGAGKSTLVDRLTAEARAAGRDRRRHRRRSDQPVHRRRHPRRSRAHAGARRPIRTSSSAAWRRAGSSAGWRASTTDAALVLDAAGKSLVIIETVGVGQDEVDIVRTADVSIVMLVPGTGDEVQALKAGIMEIADIFVVNKADREGADRLVTAVESNLALQTYAAGEWRPPIIKTEATTGRGVTELWAAIQALPGAVGRRRSRRRQQTRGEFRLRELLTQRFLDARRAARPRAGRDAARSSIASRARELDPYSAAAEILGAWCDQDRRIGTGSSDEGTTGSHRDRGEGPRAALAFYRDALGLEIEPPEDVAAQKVRAHFIPVGEASLELLEATAPDSPIARYIEKRGPGHPPHHAARGRHSRGAGAG